ncbi:hypothetical protein FACHB389_02140 [Nostoc calcicola FACHB-389]|nr:hypothetical protein FACHB389_02140 [Nostoc calcicola FACHB-389]
MKTKTLTAIIHKEEDMYVAECPEVGTVDQGETIEEALANLKEATRLYLEECPSFDTDTSPRFVTSNEMLYSYTNKVKLSCLMNLDKRP